MVMEVARLLAFRSGDNKPWDPATLDTLSPDVVVPLHLRPVEVRLHGVEEVLVGFLIITRWRSVSIGHVFGQDLGLAAHLTDENLGKLLSIQLDRVVVHDTFPEFQELEDPVISEPLKVCNLL